VGEDGAVDRLILGAGLAGCALAYHLARREAGSVRVYDPRTPAAGASGRAAGVVTEQLWDRWDVEVTRESHREYVELCRRWEPDAYQPTGFVRWTRDTECAAALDAAHRRLREWGVAVEEVGPRELERWIPPGRFDDVRMALHSPHDGAVRPSSLTAVYAEGARSAGVRFDFGVPARRLARSQGRWELTTAQGTVRARELVVAAGAWSKGVLAGIRHPLPLAPYRTRAALVRPPRSPGAFPVAHDLDTDVYVRPEEAGRILAGDGTERVECDPDGRSAEGDSAFLAHLASSLGDRFPGWADSEVVAAWAGVCTSTPDRHPIVGAVPNAPDLFVLSGFNGFGVMRAGGVARRLAEVIVEAPGPADRAALLGPADAARCVGPLRAFPPRPGFTLEGGERPRW
jgi:glycine/D-amino acid oxidase-like deaminating enzyme